MKLILASDNAHKLLEFQKLFQGTDVELMTKKEAGFTDEVAETGTTFAENAYIKAEAVMRATGCAAIADDSGLCVDALDGRPGVYSARYCGEDTPYPEKMARLIEELEGVPPEKRTARFVSVAACAFPDGTSFTVRGECEGTIGYAPVGDNGFGFDPVFMVGEKSFAQLSAEEKDAVSHRGNSLRQLAAKLRDIINN